MKVFISWSGDQARVIAECLRDWLPKVLANKVEPFYSVDDIDKGSMGLDALATELRDSEFAVVVVTRSNNEASWINFEAGAVGKAYGRARVATLLLDLTLADIPGPLGQFQTTKLHDRKDVLRLVLDVNKAVPEPLPEDSVETLFEKHWPTLEAATAEADGLVTEPKITRPTQDILDDILNEIRSLDRQISSRPGLRGLGFRDPEIDSKAR